ncbi:hypothetical protein C7974DRAFT_185038 [Boeremia exigua]|uniref:uncharacterized protein n=1 Tax=Boeremia exigua TaxID=749465 RepID=UPI001E8E9A67|nr:uncharacterized protein C7974DRAFT_185038 [Boeremia exigua]KAH6629353.1 hypothetical protein C7974DRAFT_185038 [Boeremia exigua]
MAGVLCTWAANISETAEKYYEDEYIPLMTSKLALHSLHCELVEVGLDAEVDGVGEREAPWKWLTVYEMEDADKATAAVYDKSNHIEMAGDMAQARFDVRTYKEHKRWQQGDWQGGTRTILHRHQHKEANQETDHADIVSVAVMEWQIRAGSEQEVLDFYKSEAAPTIASSPDVLRFRMFQVQNATVLKAGSYDTLEQEKLHTYLTLVELETEEWPWDAVVALGEKPKWREYFDKQNVVKWQSSHYLVKRSYPDSDEGSDKQ